MAAGAGPYLTDVDGNEYVDLVGSWGPMILGHAHPDVVEAVRRTVGGGAVVRHPEREPRCCSPRRSSPGRPVEQVRLVSLRHRGDDVGDPAGPRLHRPRPRRQVRRLLPRPRRLAAGRGRLGRRDARAARHPRRHRRVRRPTPSSCPTTTSPRSRRTFAQHGDQIACVITRGGRGEHGRGAAPGPASTPASPRLCRRRTGRCCPQRRGDDRVPRQPVRLLGPRRQSEGWTPDLMTFGKVMGGGLPAAAFGGRADVMARLAPVGPVYQAGTLSGNPVATAAGLATLRLRPTTCTRTLDARCGPGAAARLARRCRRPACRTSCRRPATCSASSSLTRRDDRDPRLRRRQRVRTAPATPRSSTRCSTRGVYLPPSAFEAWFVSAAHDDAALDRIARRAARAARLPLPPPPRGPRDDGCRRHRSSRPARSSR